MAPYRFRVSRRDTPPRASPLVADPVPPDPGPSAFIGAAAVLSPLAMSSSRDDPSFAYSGKAHQVPRLPSANPLRRVNPSLAKENLILRYAELHERCGHQHPRVMRKAVDFVTRSGPSWTNCGLTGAQIMRASKLYTCPYCVLSKRRRDPVPVNVDPPHFAGVPGYLSSKIAAPGDIISFDPQTCTPAASDGSSNWFLFKDISTGMNHVTFSTDAQMPTVQAAVDRVFSWYKSNGCVPKLLRTDTSKVVLSPGFHTWLLEKWNATVQRSLPYAHWQNAVERDVQSIVRGTSCLLHAQRWLRADSWHLALSHFIELRNRTPRAHSSQSPIQLLTGEVCDWSTMNRFAFGDLLAVSTGNLPADGRDWQFDTNNQLAIYVGNPPATKRGCLVYFPSSRQVLERLHCWRIDMSDAQFVNFFEKRVRIREASSPYRDVSNAMHDFRIVIVPDAATPSALLQEIPLDPDPVVDSEAIGDHSDEDTFTSTESFMRDLPSEPPPSIPAPLHRMNLRSSGLAAFLQPSVSVPVLPVSVPVLPESSVSVNVLSEPSVPPVPSPSLTTIDTLGDLLETYGAYCWATALIGSAPLTVARALKSAESAQWKEAIKDEILNKMMKDGTLVPETPVPGTDYKIIHSTMPLKCKTHQDGSLDKFKARLCACGNELLNFILDTYSPTVNALTHAVVHQIAIIDNMSKCVVDVTGAYLHQVYPKDAPPLYLTLPDAVADVCGLPRGATYRIYKYLYGLPDAGLAYYKAYSSHLIAGGYKRTVSDPCLFVKKSTAGVTYVCTHVDDTFVCASSPELLTAFKTHVSTAYPITFEDNVEEYLGIKLTKTDAGVLLTQPKLLNALELEYHDQLQPFLRVKAPQRPIALQSIDLTPMDSKEYLHLLGSLNYLTKSRPDIQTAVSFAARHGAKPTRGHFQELLHCLAYIVKSHDKGLLLRRGVPGAPLRLRCYADASYLTHGDTSQSQSGYCMSFGEIGTFYSKSSVQKLVSTSSTHSELRALYALTVDLVFIVHLCDELHRPLELPSIVLIDNQPLLALTQDVTPRSKSSKHFLMLVDWLREQISAGYLELVKIPSAENVADILTKIITGGEFSNKASLLCGWL